MQKLINRIVLLCTVATCMLGSEARSSGEKPEEKSDAFTLLNNYLIYQTSYTDFETFRDLAEQVIKSPGIYRDSPAVLDLAGQISKLSVDNKLDAFCSVGNLVNLRRVIDVSLASNPDAFTKPESVLASSLVNYIEKGPSCVMKFVQEWDKSKPCITLFKKYDNSLSPLDMINKNYPIIRDRGNLELNELDGALERVNNYRSRERCNEHPSSVFSPVELNSIGHSQAASKEEASKLFEKEILEPCRRLVAEEVSQTTLRPTAIYASLAKVDDHIRKLLPRTKSFHLARWSARFAICELLLCQN